MVMLFSLTNHLYLSGMAINSAILIMNMFLSCSTPITNNSLIEDKDIPPLPQQIPRCISAFLGYLHIHLAQSSGGSVSLGMFILASAFWLLSFAGRHASIGIHPSVFHFNNAVFCTGNQFSLRLFWVSHMYACICARASLLP
jgi:hypothetical protein